MADAITPEAFMRLYERATDAHDIESLLPLIADDAVYFFSNETTHVGKTAVRAVLEKNFSLISEEAYALNNITWLLKSDAAAVCVYDYSWSGVIGGKPASGSGRGTTALRAQAGGWKVVHEHLSKGKLGD